MIDMPTFLTDESLPNYAANNDIFDLDPSRHFDLVDKKVTGDTIRCVPSGPINETYESSTSSVHDSEASEVMPTTTTTTSTTTQNGPEYEGMNGEDGASLNEKIEDMADHHTSSFSFTSNLPDRTRLSNHKDEKNDASPYPTKQETMGKAMDSSNGHVHSRSRSYSKSMDGYTPQLSAIPSETESISPQPQTPKKSTLPSTTTDAPHRSSPHRYSSPPIFQPSMQGSNSSSSGYLHPPHPGSALRHRHTLEVPKVTPARGSGDGSDTAQSSGRFSPTPGGGTPRRASMGIPRMGRSMYSETARDEVVADEDTIRWQATVRQKRASKRKRREENDDDRVLVGTKVDESHANWVTAYNMLTSIRVSVSRTNAKLDRDVIDADFDAKQKATFDVAGNELVPSAKYDFKFKDYAPWVFRHLRALFHLDPADYLMSLTGKYILSELGSPGKSGSFFYFSRDYKYIIKTIHHSEHKFLRHILKDYYNHVKENPNTLLSQFYGLHRVKTPYGKKIHFVVMNNLFPPHRDIHTTFDLKGSTIGRDYKEDDLKNNPRATLKDLNWLRRQRHLELGIQKKRMFLEQLQKDVKLMKKLHIMDYSLLVGVHDLSRGNEENLRDKTLQVFQPGGEKPEEEPQALMRTPSKLESARKTRELRQMLRSERPIPIGQASDRMPDELDESHARPGFVFNQDDGGFRATHEDNQPADEIYYLGVIDCLTHYGIIKKLEHFWKGLSSDKNQISALPPQQYGDRFFHFVEGITLSPEAAAAEEARRLEAEARQVSIEKSSRNSRHKKDIPPMPEYRPPPPPPPHQSDNIAGGRSSEGREALRMANREVEISEKKGASEAKVPDITLRTATMKTRDSLGDPVLPVVEETGEGAGSGSASASASRNSREHSEARPATPLKDKPLPPSRAPPPTPPKTMTPSGDRRLHPDSADSGYEGHEGSLKLSRKLSREDLDKSLPPIPLSEEGGERSYRAVA